MGVEMGVALRELTLSELYEEVLGGIFKNDVVYQYVLGYDDVMYQRALTDDRVDSEVEEELNYMTDLDYARMVEHLNLPVRIVG